MSSRRARFLILAGLAGVASACGGRQPPPEAGEFVGSVPDLMGRTVMVLPVQTTDGVPDPVDPELEFALNEHGQGIEWVFPDRLRRHVDRTPSLDINLDNLPVGIFFRGEVERVGDPLFGDIRRLAGITGADVAIIPLRVRYRMASDSVPSGIEVMSTVLDAVSGRVFWTGVVEGAPGAADSPGTLASAADSFARHMAWSASRSPE